MLRCHCSDGIDTSSLCFLISWTYVEQDSFSGSLDIIRRQSCIQSVNLARSWQSILGHIDGSHLEVFMVYVSTWLRFSASAGWKLVSYISFTLSRLLFYSLLYALVNVGTKTVVSLSFDRFLEVDQGHFRPRNGVSLKALQSNSSACFKKIASIRRACAI